MVDEVLAELIADKDRTRILALQPGALGAVAHDDLAAVPRHAQEGVDVLLNGDAPDVGRDRPRQVEKILCRRLEFFRVHAALPARQILEAVRRKIRAHRSGAYHATHGGSMETPQHSVRYVQRYGESRPQVLRKLRVIRGGEADSALDAEAPCAEAQGAFGRDMQRLRRECENVARDFLVRKQR